MTNTAPSNSSKIPVLIIDDEQDIRDGCGRILNRMECDVYKSSCGEDGLELLSRKEIMIVLLDLKMPGMDGIEVLRRIRERDKDILVIIITGYATVETAIDAMKKGAYDFISKPFTPDHLRIVVNRAMEKLRLAEETAELKKAKQRTLVDLGREKSRLRTIVESLPNGVLVTDTLGEIVLINPSAQAHLDLTTDNPLGDIIKKHITDKFFLKFIMTMSMGDFDEKEQIPSYEFAGADEKFILARGKSIRADNGECLGAVINLMDITAMKVLDRLKSEFVAKVSHELRSPLATIHEQLNFILKEKPQTDNKNEQHLISRAKEKTMGLISFIGDLLDLSRIEAGDQHSKSKPVELDSLLENMVDFLSVRANAKKQPLTLHKCAEKVPVLETDPMAIESIFGNLITNAIIYTPEEGSIDIFIETNETAVVVRVTDTGFGIDEKYLDKIFDRFYRVKNSNTRYITGTGLGLPIVKSLVDAVGGTIRVDSTPGKGSTFTVTLPV